MSVDRRIIDEGLAYHSARLLILIRAYGAPRGQPGNPAIVGRTLLAKLDFFLRYPAYLQKAAQIRKRAVDRQSLGIDSVDELDTVESHMVRFRYGPWDHIYYPTLAYLIGKQLMRIDSAAGTDVFRLTDAGIAVADRLAGEPEYESVARRAATVGRLFKSFNGNGLKEFVYANFPEVVRRKLGESI